MAFNYLHPDKIRGTEQALLGKRKPRRRAPRVSGLGTGPTLVERLAVKMAAERNRGR